MVFFATTARAEDPGSGVRGRILDPSGLPLPGVAITLTPANASQQFTGVTDQNGEYSLVTPEGHYRFTAELAGFQQIDVEDVVVQPGIPTTFDTTLALGELHDTVTVTAETPQVSVLGEAEPNAVATVTRPVIDNAMVWNNRYEDVLTLMPNVVRGPDNRISIAGAPSSTGALVVDGFDETDPVSGEPGLVVPLDGIDAIDVHAGGYPADFGRSTGGLTSIRTRAGSNEFHMSADSLLPRMLFEDGTMHGVEYWEPNAGARGPIVKDRLFFEDAFSYRYDRNRFDTLAGVERNTYNQPLSWSELDANVSSRQRLRLAFGFDQQHTDPANITAFTPDTTVPDLAQDGWSVSVSDHFNIRRTATLELRTSWLDTHSSVAPHQGNLPYFLGHELAAGSYFDRRSRDGRRAQAGFTWTFMPTTRQVVSTGASVDNASFRESDVASPVSFLRSDGTVSRVVAFSATAPAEVTTNQVAASVQDAWTPRPWVTIDAGVRYDRMTAIGDTTLVPRLAWTVKTNHDELSISGSVGLYGDKVPLAALAFPSMPARIEHDVSGRLLAFAVPMFNRIDGSLLMPRAVRWDLGVDRPLPHGMLGHVRYQQRDGRDELIVDPVADPTGTRSLVLSSRGASRARSLEATLGIRRTRSADEIYVSYVRATATGDLNTFDTVEGLFRAPLVRPNEVGPLPADVPHHFLAWGLLHMPGRVTVAPFLDIRSGFPYSPINDDWEFSGPRNGARLPWAGTLDLSVLRVVDLPGRLPHARAGLKFYNLASFNTEREVQRDVDSPAYGTRYDPTFRDFSFVCTFLVGQH
jgi:hypothetical protein